MAGNSREEDGASCSVDAHKSAKLDLVECRPEWRSWEQLEPSPPSTSPAWNTEEDEDSGSCVPGTRPSDLYGKFTWKIENFSQISKRELRSNMFEVGGYKWYILVYPQGCDVCNHLSLFLCVADYDKLLPGWSHFVQFTIAVVNKDPKKSKYSDTLHRFCKKEHDWGWKKFMELSKVLDGFTVADTLVIKAQVQVIRENPHRPFRCLDSQYRRELVRVYMTNVEGICRRFVEEKREKIGKLMEDPVRWPSFRSFWSALEENTKRRLSREKMEIILKAIVKAFFNEKEVTSTLVMDALYSGCKALDYRSKSKKGKANGVEKEEARSPVTWADKEFFVLAGDVLFLLERAASETLPSYKDEKGPQNRTKDGGSGDDFGKDSMERDERRLTELGKRTVEMFVLAHIFSNRVEVAYLEAIALKRQEELIREEEAAGQAEIELKAKREAAEKEKRNKKKQAKQRRNSRKEKEKDGEDKHQVAGQHEDSSRSRASLSLSKETSAASVDMVDDDDDSSVLDNTDGVVGTLRAALEDGESEQNFWEREGSELHQAMEASFSGGSSIASAQNGRSNRKHQVLVDDSSSTCSSDSIPSNSAASAGYGRRRSNTAEQNSTSVNRARGRISNDKGLLLGETKGAIRGRSGIVSSTDTNSSNGVGHLDADTVISSLKKRVQWLQQRLLEKEEEVVLLHEQLSLYQHHYGNLPQKEDDHKIIKVDDRAQTQSGLESEVPLSPHRAVRNLMKFERRIREELQSMGTEHAKDHHTLNESAGFSHSDSAANSNIPGARASGTSGQNLSTSLTRVLNATPENVPVHGLSGGPVPCATSQPNACAGGSTEPGMPRPSSAPGLPEAPRGHTPTMQQSAPALLLACSVSATGRLGVSTTEPTTSVSSLSSPLSSQPGSAVMPSYRNAAAGMVRSSSTAGAMISDVGQTCNESYGLSQAFQAVGEQSALAGCMYPKSLCVTAGQGSTAAVPAVAMGETAMHENGKVSVVEARKVGYPTQQSEPRRPGMRLTFGTVTPDVLHLQHHQQHRYVSIDGIPTEAKLPSQGQDLFQGEHHQGHVEERRAHKDLQNFVQQQLNPGASFGVSNASAQNDTLQGSIGQLSGAVQARGQPGEQLSFSGTLMSEEFPHLDIINELLDEDKMLGLNVFLQQPAAIDELQRIYAGRMGLDMTTSHGNLTESSDRGLHQDTSGLPQLPNSAESIFNGLGKGMQLHPFAHALLQGNPGVLMDAVPGHYWQGPSSDMPVTSTDARQSGLDVYMGYPMQSNHLPIVDCPPFSVGQNGYPLYSPIKHP